MRSRPVASPRRVKATPVHLHAEMSLSGAFNAITASCLNHLLSNEPGMLEGRDIEYLHQMRVAVRRQRSALSIFSTAIPRRVYRDSGGVEVAYTANWPSSRLGRICN